MPSEDESIALYRGALSSWATGVAIITTIAQGEVWALTINSLVSISLQPRLVMWSLGSYSDRFGMFCDAPTWGVNVLAADQDGLSNQFAAADAPPPPADLIETPPGGPPLLKNALAR